MSVADDLINDARDYSAQVLNKANGEVASAMAIAQALGNYSPLGAKGGDDFPVLDIRPPVPGDPGAPPQYTGTRFKAPTLSAREPNLDNVPQFILPGDPGAPPSVAGFNAPMQPSPTADGTLLQGVPTLADVDDIPAAPDLMHEIAAIVPPTLTDVTIGPAPTFQAPEFLGTEPVLPSAPPTGLDKVQRTQYDMILPAMRAAVSDQLDAFLDREFPQFRSGMAAIEERLATYLAGGTALKPEVENAIYNRTLDKTNTDAKRARQTVLGQGARAGFTIPPITLLQQLQDVDQERRNNNARAATDIAVKQAELEQQNLQWAVTQSANLRQVAITAALGYYTGLVQLNGQALEYARDVVQAIVQTYDLAVKYTDVQARVFEAQANVFRARLEGSLAVIQAYEAQVRAEEAKVNVDRAKVDAYRARIEAVQAEANVYRAQVDAVVAKAQIERVKVDLYQARVQAYGAQINAYTAQWQGYSAAVNGEAAKVSASAEAVRAFTSQVEAYRARIQAQSVAIESVTRTNEAKLHAYATQIEAYRALVEGEAIAVKAEVESFDVTIKAFIAKAEAVSQKSRAQISSYEAGMRGLIAEADVLLRKLQEDNRIRIARVDAVARIATAGADINGRIAQSALSGMNSLAVQEVVESA